MSLISLAVASPSSSGWTYLKSWSAKSPESSLALSVMSSASHRESMPARYEDLHGNVPDQSEVALLMIDVINDLEFDGGEALLKHALPMAQCLAALKQRAKQARIPVIYVNDNFGKWQSDFKKQVRHCL